MCFVYTSKVIHQARFFLNYSFYFLLKQNYKTIFYDKLLKRYLLIFYVDVGT